MEYYNKIDSVYLNALKQEIIYPVFKVELMDFAENVIGELTQDISKEDSGSISINYQQGVRRSCSLTLINAADNLHITQGKYALNENGLWINTKFKLYTGIRVPYQTKLDINLNYDFEGNTVLYEDVATSTLIYKNKDSQMQEDIYLFSQGVYLLTDPNVLRDMSKKTITINGIDKFGVFGSETNFNQTEATYLIPADSTVADVVTSILNFDKGNGLPLDIKKPYIDASIAAEKIPYDINKSPETYFADILIEMANMFACDIYYDTEGTFHFEKGNEQRQMDEMASLWDYSDKNTEYFAPQLTYDFKNVYNSIVVIGNNPATDLFQYKARNDNPASPTRISLIGEKILYIESSFCYNQDRTIDFANYMLKKKSMVSLTLSFQSSFIPHLEVNNVITITDEYLNYVQQRFVIQSLNIPLTTKSLIDIECTDTAMIPYFEY